MTFHTAHRHQAVRIHIHSVELPLANDYGPYLAVVRRCGAWPMGSRPPRTVRRHEKGDESVGTELLLPAGNRAGLCAAVSLLRSVLGPIVRMAWPILRREVFVPWGSEARKVSVQLSVR